VVRGSLLPGGLAGIELRLGRISSGELLTAFHSGVGWMLKSSVQGSFQVAVSLRAAHDCRGQIIQDVSAYFPICFELSPGFPTVLHPFPPPLAAPKLGPCRGSSLGVSVFSLFGCDRHGLGLSLWTGVVQIAVLRAGTRLGTPILLCLGFWFAHLAPLLPALPRA
jgi:hypothetical protein